jgi:hypothetical protein
MANNKSAKIYPAGPVCEGTDDIETVNLPSSGAPAKTLSKAKSKKGGAPPLALSIDEIAKNIDVDGDGQIDPEEQEILDLLKSMDTDGDGTIGIKELVNLGNTLQQSKEQVGQLKKIFIAVACLSVLFLGVMFVVCFSAVEAGKDSTPSGGGRMETVEGKRVSVDGNVETMSLDTMHYLAPETLKQIDEIGFQLGNTYYNFGIVGFEQTAVSDAGLSLILHLAGGSGQDYVFCSDTEVALYNGATGEKVDLMSAELARKAHRRSLLEATGRELLQDEFEAGAAVPNTPVSLPDDFVNVPADSY